MSIRTRVVAGACTMTLVLTASLGSAQDRFTVLTQSPLGEIPGLRVLTVRDQQLSMCYTLFVVDSPVTLEAPPTDVPAEDANALSVQRIREAAVQRDRELAALKSSRQRYLSSDPVATARYEADRKRVEEQYERVLREEIPGSTSWNSRLPGRITGGWEDAGNAMRRALVDPEPTSTMKTLVDQFARIENLLRQSMAAAQRVAVAGPAACAAAPGAVPTAAR